MTLQLTSQIGLYFLLGTILLEGIHKLLLKNLFMILIMKNFLKLPKISYFECHYAKYNSAVHQFAECHSVQ
jgi:hypothetical protein